MSAADGVGLVVNMFSRIMGVENELIDFRWIEMKYTYNLSGKFDYFGVSFDLPEQNVKSMKWLGNGPYRVYKNRLPGGKLGVFSDASGATISVPATAPDKISSTIVLTVKGTLNID